VAANEILHRVVGGLPVLYEGVILGTRPNFCSVTEAAMGDELRLSAIERRT
jgi:hypothetical protein